MDGDTLKLARRARVETVRLIGIDTPETVAPGRPVECGGPEAARSLRRAAPQGAPAAAAADSTQANRDPYGRLLRYVSVDDSDLGRTLVRSGWAKVYVYDRPFVRLPGYRRAYKRAQESPSGVHRECGGDFHAASPP